MLKKDSKFNIIKKANYQSEKQIENVKYPDLYNNSKYGYNNSSKFNVSTNKKRLSSSNSKQLPRTASGFFERNYNNYLEKIFSKKNFINSSMISTKELNDLLYKLKNYNNEIMTYINQKDNSLKHLKETLKLIEFKYNKLKELQDIELPEEKISVKNFNELKMSKDDIEQKLYMLIKEKQEIDYSLKNEQEYNKTIEYMFEDEQNRLLSIKRETNIIEQKIYNVQKYQKIVNDNLTKAGKKDKNYEELNSKIDNDIILINEVNNKQKIDNQKLEHEIMLKEREVKILEDQIKQLKENNNSDLNEYKNEVKEEIEQAKELEKKRIEDEKKYIEIIYCLYIIQKYFIEEENFNKEKLLSSKDYTFLTKMIPDFISSFNNKKITSEENATKNNFEKIATNASNNNNKRETNRALSSIKYNNNYTSDTMTQEDKKSFIATNKTNSACNLNKNKSMKTNNLNKTSSTFYNTKLDINSYYNNNNNNNIEDLIDKFNEIKLNKQMLFDYNSSLMSKLNFYRNQLNDFHFKEIKLEGIKNNYETKVKNIISDNYFSFEELIKYNEKCQKFLEKNEFFINKMKKVNTKKKKKLIIDKLNKDNLDDSDNELEEEKIKIISNEEEKEIEADDIVFKNSKNLIMNINNFFITCSDLLKDIIISINNIKSANETGDAKGDKKNITSKYEDDNSIFMKENNITDENSDNPYIEVFKKLVEYQKIKEIDISRDYKLLLQYIKNLLRFIEDQNIKELNSSELKNNLIDKFYINGEDSNSKKVDKLFIKRFLSKKNPNFNNIYNHFTILLEPTMTYIKSLYQIIHDDSSKEYLDNIIKNKTELKPKCASNKKLIEQFSNSENISKNENTEKDHNKVKKYRRLSSSKSEIYKNEELCYDEEDIDSIDTQSTKKKVVKIRKKVKSIDEKVINNLYTPFLKKTVYLRKLNPNIPGIKQMTSNSSKNNFELKKMINDVDTISYQMKIYNNPLLDPNKLSNSTYNSLVKLMLNDSNKNNVKGKKKNKKKKVSIK